MFDLEISNRPSSQEDIKIIRIIIRSMRSIFTKKKGPNALYLVYALTYSINTLHMGLKYGETLNCKGPISPVQNILQKKVIRCVAHEECIEHTQFLFQKFHIVKLRLRIFTSC